jgi:hypothetical protein
MFEHQILDALLTVVEPLIMDTDRFRQRSAVEILAGLLRGAQYFCQRGHCRTTGRYRFQALVKAMVRQTLAARNWAFEKGISAN